MKRQKKTKQKALFIDANIFISCLLGEKEKTNLNVIKKIEQNIKDNTLLILPECIEAEVVKGISNKFDGLRNHLNNINTKSRASEKDDDYQVKKDVLKSLQEGLELAKKAALEGLKKSKEEILNEFLNFLKNKNIRKIFLSNSNAISGIKRSLLQIRPHSDFIEGDDKHKGSFLGDQDCVNFECLLECLKNNKDKFDKVIICSDDKDYFTDKESTILHIDISSDVKKEGCDVVGYRDPLDMLEKEFKTSFTSAQKKGYNETKQKLSSVWLDNLSVATTRPSASIGALSAFDYCSPYTTAYVTRCSNQITRDSEDCPICGENIKKHLRAYLVHHKSVDVFATTKTVFECPFCRNELMLYPSYPW